MRKGRPKGCVDSDGGRATAIGIVCASVAIGRGAGAVGADYLGVRRGHGQQSGRAPAARDAGHGLANGAGGSSWID